MHAAAAATFSGAMLRVAEASAESVSNLGYRDNRDSRPLYRRAVHYRGTGSPSD
jgi:hypothetical protein